MPNMFIVSKASHGATFPAQVIGVCWDRDAAKGIAEDPLQWPYEIKWRRSQPKRQIGDLFSGKTKKMTIPAYVQIETCEARDLLQGQPPKGDQFRQNVDLVGVAMRQLMLRQDVRTTVELMREEEINPVGQAMEAAIAQVIDAHGTVHALAGAYVSLLQLENYKRKLIGEDNATGDSVVAELDALREVVIQDLNSIEGREDSTTNMERGIAAFRLMNTAPAPLLETE